MPNQPSQATFANARTRKANSIFNEDEYDRIRYAVYLSKSPSVSAFLRDAGLQEAQRIIDDNNKEGSP